MVLISHSIVAKIITRTVGLKAVTNKSLCSRLGIAQQNTMTTVAVGQMTSKGNKEKNFATCVNLIEKAKAKGAKILFLPEACDYIAETKEQSVEMAEPLNGSLMTRFKQLAKDNELWLSIGGFHEKGANMEDNRIFNSHVLIDSSGEFSGIYRKCHLFDVTLQTGQKLHESNYVIPGKEIISPVASPVGKIGLGICYDLRFPEMSSYLARMGAEILTFPSAFTIPTGKAHWEILLRSRSIENQCYVIAAAQTGVHNTKRSSYGHAMIVDPWGTVIAECDEGTGIAVADLDMSQLQKIRMDMPVQQHRRNELYRNPRVDASTSISSNPVDFAGDSTDEWFQFGQIRIHKSQIFYRTALTMAFTNKKPVLPGHVLVSPLRCTKKYIDLTSEEISDLFQVVQKVQRVIEQEFVANSSTIAIQDGPDAGQSIEHVHVHILPRKPRDFSHPDLVYVELQKHDKPDAEEKMKWRTDEEMATEATRLAKYF